MEKNFYLNISNSKYLTIGIKPASKLFNTESTGFYVDVCIGGNMKPMSLGGLDGFMNLCQALRSFEELKFTYPMSAGNYDEMEAAMPLNISKRPYQGMMCFCIENELDQRASMAQNTCSELLKFENLIISNIKFLQTLATQMEAKFNTLVKKCASDYPATIKEVENSKDTFSSDVLTNFNELLRACMDQFVRFESASTSGTTPSKRKRNAANAVKAKKTVEERPVKSKKTQEDHSYAADTETEASIGDHANETEATVTISDSADVGSEIEDGSDSPQSNKSVEPLGIQESGQRFESELYM